MNRFENDMYDNDMNSYEYDFEDVMNYDEDALQEKLYFTKKE